ncbi:MAG: pyridoxal phosphate-dependent aminotransferase [Lachnospiraceae bacterium]|nr:pyridoxal phosphate-dependent aminotransferase [Lachnospiraceae bacterium]
MISKKMEGLVRNNSVIRQMFEEGQRMAQEFGAENVYDFSLGNPNVPAPEKVKESIIRLASEENPLKLHGYMSNAGFPEVRRRIADSLNKRFGTAFDENNIMMTVGAAGGLNCALRAILNPGDEVLSFVPYFLEYRNYVNNFDGKLVEVGTTPETFMPDLADLERKIGPKTRALIINNPNNPTGVVYSEEVIRAVSGILEKAQEKYGSEIFIISDEPYRELVYSDKEVPFITKYYKNTLVGYSYSKSLSLPGERIGYLVVPYEAAGYEELFAAVTIANRVMGFVNAPSLMQLVIGDCVDEKADIDFYRKNRDMIYDALTSYGFTCVKPEGAFYLFLKSPIEDEREFVAQAKEEHILLVPGSSFSCKGYVRLAYCVSHEMISRSLPAFKRLAEKLL